MGDEHLFQPFECNCPVYSAFVGCSKQLLVYFSLFNRKPLVLKAPALENDGWWDCHPCG